MSTSPECEATWRDFCPAKDHCSANSGLKAQEYSGPILGIIFLRFAEVCFVLRRADGASTRQPRATPWELDRAQ
jgi:hypothetical protein